MNICESLTVTARLFPAHAALVYNGESISYQRLNQLSAAAAKVLSAAGVAAGDRVALMLPNAPAFAVWYYGALRLGAVVAAVSTRLAASEVEFITSDCAATAFVGNGDSVDWVRQALGDTVRFQIAVNEVDGQALGGEAWSLEAGDEQVWYEAEPDDAALILYTSGTTGFPKGATLSHRNVRSNVAAFNHLCQMEQTDRVLLAVPLFHCFGQNALLNSVLNVGGTLVLQQRFDLNESKRLIADHSITQLYGVPMMFGLLLESCGPTDLASVHYCFSAAAALPIQTSRAWQEKFGMPIHEGYGLTETSPFATYNHRIKYTCGSIGMPIDGVEVRVVDSKTGEECPPGDLGEIAIRGPNVMLGYWNRPEETANAIRDGWFYSGDIGRVDDAGYLYIVDRVKDMITVGGLKVFPAEVERVLLDHALVLQAAVIGVPDPVFGEQVVAYLVIHECADQERAIVEVQQHVRLGLGSYKLPRRLLVLDELPRNPSGKVLKTRLREMAAELPAVGGEKASKSFSASSALVSDLRPPSLADKLSCSHESEKLRVAMTFLQEQVQRGCELATEPELEASFVEAGMDSLAMVSLSSQLQVEVGTRVDLPPTLLFDYPRVADLAEFLVATLADSQKDDSQKDDSQKAGQSRVDTVVGPSSGFMKAPHPRDGVGEKMKPKQTVELKQEIENMSEEDALAALMKELD